MEKLYAVKVFESGLQKYHQPLYVMASDARDACDQVERNLGLEPPRIVQGERGYYLVGRLIEFRCREVS